MPADRHALDKALPDLRRPNNAIVDQAMEGLVLADTVSMGTYSPGG